MDRIEAPEFLEIGSSFLHVLLFGAFPSSSMSKYWPTVWTVSCPLIQLLTAWRAFRFSNGVRSGGMLLLAKGKIK
jgi:hypothetical protein